MLWLAVLINQWGIWLAGLIPSRQEKAYGTTKINEAMGLGIRQV